MNNDYAKDPTAKLLADVCDRYWKEDQAVREQQVRKWRRMKLFWDGFTRTWYSEVAHDWRIYDPAYLDDNGQQDYYDKPVNIFRAYLESLIAALSVTIPPIKCFPDDADNNLDLLTAKAGDRIAKLIYRHIDAQQIWLNGLFIYCTEGTVFAYNKTEESPKYGMTREPQFENEYEQHEYQLCANCGFQLADVTLSEQAEAEYDPDNDDVLAQDYLQREEMLCPECLSIAAPDINRDNLVVTRIIGYTETPKSRVCIETYGGLNVKIPVNAKFQKDIPYLFFSREVNFAVARDMYPHIRNEIQPGQSGIEPYERWARTSTQYLGQEPEDVVTLKTAWLRPCAFECLADEKEAKELRKKFPNGARVVYVNDIIAEYENESLDDHWTITQNPLADNLYFDPLGMLLTSVQEITNDIISLGVQTIEHGIPQTFADPAVLDFNMYGQQETSPGAIYPATPKSGKGMQDAFYEVKTAALSQEVLPFASQIQSLGQTVSGALPSLFGGDIQGSKTASQYSMSRAQALQRLQNTWKMFTTWWKQIYGKAIPAYIKTVRDMEKYVERDSSGNFINIVIHRAELEGKLGQIELESNENLPITFAQQKDTIMKMLQTQHPVLQQLLMDPENLPLLYDAFGIPELSIPGEDSRNKQYDEIRILVNSEPLMVPPDIMQAEQMQMQGMPIEPIPQPSVEVGEFDRHQIELEICIKWLNSEAGKLAKFDNPPGYQNVLLHAKAHKDAMMQQMMEQMMANPGAGAPPEKPNEKDKEAPITGDGDVQVN